MGKTYLTAVSSLRLPASSSSEACLLAFRDDWREFFAELVREVWPELMREVRPEPSLEAALRDMVLPLSKT